MSFGSSAYGSTAYGGRANASNEQIFFSYPEPERAADVLYEATALFNGTTTFYEILTLQGSEGTGPSGIEYKVYTLNGQGQTPQLQVTLGGNGQSIIYAAPIIIVTALIDGTVWAFGTNFGVKGRPYTQ